MTLALLAVVVGGLAGLVAGRRRLRRSWRASYLLAAGVLLTGAGDLALSGAAGVTAEVCGMSVTALFCMVNWRHPGLVLVAAGLVANALVIGLDDGMPVRGQPAGLAMSRHHHGVSRTDRVTGLSDSLRLPGTSVEASPGDVAAAVGGACAAFFLLLPPADRRRHLAAG